LLKVSPHRRRLPRSSTLRAARDWARTGCSDAARFPRSIGLTDFPLRTMSGAFAIRLDPGRAEPTRRTTATSRTTSGGGACCRDMRPPLSTHSGSREMAQLEYRSRAAFQPRVVYGTRVLGVFVDRRAVVGTSEVYYRRLGT
jgi:hypothetical protein